MLPLQSLHWKNYLRPLSLFMRNSIPAGSTPHQDAFSLIELLVTVAIIAILASMLLPTLARAREAGRAALCMNNMRQFSIGVATYTLDFYGHLPSFRDWLDNHVKNSRDAGNLMSGTLYPYIKAKGPYLCPTDKLELSSRKRIPAPSSGFGFVNKPRDYSYGMSCGICHVTELATFKEPVKTMVFMEAFLATNDYSGQVGPMGEIRTISLRHINRGHVLFADSHVVKMGKAEYDKRSKTKRFWFPTDDTSGPRGMNFGGGLQ
jgi:prepilin-type N-terminal cleavage/methylation domain-containing protein/prepilin-type processing-associated H-X9-DG protein